MIITLSLRIPNIIMKDLGLSPVPNHTTYSFPIHTHNHTTCSFPIQAHSSRPILTAKGPASFLRKDLRVKMSAHHAPSIILNNDSETKQNIILPYKEGTTLERYSRFTHKAKESPYPVSHGSNKAWRSWFNQPRSLYSQGKQRSKTRENSGYLLDWKQAFKNDFFRGFYLPE
ncbi:hypothetical protein LR48_Vigan10g102600 [Vigna angularis]|uniref:Uncharacterized protein n=1 Tax=Phaseolus angularis TaxID=3914 RepID=A0A0L9VK78_PHAAN|nr:hypothetical protein LR48_Vigan10g102600 [Vigna angularis]